MVHTPRNYSRGFVSVAVLGSFALLFLFGIHIFEGLSTTPTEQGDFTAAISNYSHLADNPGQGAYGGSWSGGSSAGNTGGNAGTSGNNGSACGGCGSNASGGTGGSSKGSSSGSTSGGKSSGSTSGSAGSNAGREGSTSGPGGGSNSGGGFGPGSGNGVSGKGDRAGSGPVGGTNLGNNTNQKSTNTGNNPGNPNAAGYQGSTGPTQKDIQDVFNTRAPAVNAPTAATKGNRVGTGPFGGTNLNANNTNNSIGGVLGDVVTAVKDYVAKTYSAYNAQTQKDKALNTSIKNQDNFSFKSDTDATGPGVTSPDALSKETKQSLINMQQALGLPLSVSLKTTSLTQQTLSIAIDTSKLKAQGKIATDIDKENLAVEAALAGFSHVRANSQSVSVDSVSHPAGSTPAATSNTAGNTASSNNENTANNDGREGQTSGPGNPSNGKGGPENNTSGTRTTAGGDVQAGVNSITGGIKGGTLSGPTGSNTGSTNTGNNPGNPNASGYQGDFSGTPTGSAVSNDGREGQTSGPGNPTNGKGGPTAATKGDRVGTGPFGGTNLNANENSSLSSIFGGVPATHVKTTSIPGNSAGVVSVTSGTPAPTNAVPPNQVHSTTITADQNTPISFTAPHTTTPQNNPGIVSGVVSYIGRITSRQNTTPSVGTQPAQNLVGQREGGSGGHSTSTAVVPRVGLLCQWFGWYCPTVPVIEENLIPIDSTIPLTEI